MSDNNNNADLDLNATTTQTGEGANGEKVTRKTTTTVRSSNVGFFGRIARALQDRPIATSVGITAGAGAAGFGAYNYRRHGSVLPAAMSSSDVVDVARAAAGLFGR